MRKLREILSVSTLVPVLLSGQTVMVRAEDPTALPGATNLRLAQTAPAGEEDPKHRRAPGEHRPAPGAAPAPTRAQPPAHAQPSVHAPRPAQAPVESPAHAPAPQAVTPPPSAPRAPAEIRRPAPPQAPEVRRPQVEAPVAPHVRRPEEPAAQTREPRPVAPSGERPQQMPGAAGPSGPTAPRLSAPAAPQAPVAPAPTAPTTPEAPARNPAPAPIQNAAPPPVPAPTQPNAAPTVAPRPAQPAPVAPSVVAPPVVPQAAPDALHRPRPGGPGAGPGVAPTGEPHRPPMPGQPPQGQPQSDRRGGMSPLGAAAVGAAVGVVGGMILGGEPAHGIADVQRQRRAVRDGDVTIYSEPGRVIVRDADGVRLRHDENERFRDLGGDIREERRGDDYVQDWARPDGSRIITITDQDGRLLRRIRRWPDGREVVLIDNGPSRPRGEWRRERVVVVPPRVVDRDRWEVDARRADGRVIYETLEAPPVAPLERRYTLDDVRWNRDLRSYMPSVDVDTLTFDSGSWTVDPSQYDRLATLADAINRALARDPNEIFLVEGHSDAVGDELDNLSLSDRRAQSVAAVLTRTFRVPPENLVTQGYGEQYLKVQTDGPSEANRRVTLRRITPLLERAER